MQDQDFIQITARLYAAAFKNYENKTVVSVCKKISDREIINPDYETNFRQVIGVVEGYKREYIVDDLIDEGFKAESEAAADKILEMFVK